MTNETKVAMFITGDPETEDLTSLYAPGLLGQFVDFFRKWSAADGGGWCRYRLVKCAAGITPAVGAPVYWSDKSAYEVTTANANRAKLAGVARIAPGAAARYIWVLTRGRRKVLFVAAPTSAPDAAGKPVVGSATDGKADCLALATAPPVPLIGVTAGVTAADLALVDVNVPDQA